MQRVRLPDDPSSPGFWAAYAELMQLPPPAVEREDLIRNLIEAWKMSPEWRQMSERTQQEWSRLAKLIEVGWGEFLVKSIEPKHVIKFRDGFADRPATANNIMRCMCSMMSWSVPRGWRDDNPCREIPLLKAGDGYAPWPWEIISSVEAEFKKNKREDLWWCVALALYTGQRLADVLSMRWNAINASGLLAVKQGKTGKELLIPIHRELKAVLATIPKHAVTILTSAEKTPWDDKGNGWQTAWAKHRPDILRDRGLVFHGLRKSAVVTLLEAGCTDAEVAAITGQSRKMIEHYSRQINQEKLARKAIKKWERNKK